MKYINMPKQSKAQVEKAFKKAMLEEKMSIATLPARIKQERNVKVLPS